MVAFSKFKKDPYFVFSACVGARFLKGGFLKLASHRTASNNSKESRSRMRSKFIHTVHAETYKACYHAIERDGGQAKTTVRRRARHEGAALP